MLKTRVASTVWIWAAVLLLGAGRADAHTVTLAWDANTEPDLAGYIIGYGTAPGSSSVTVDVGMATQWTLSGFTAGKTYYFRVYAYNSIGRRSAPSAEVAALVGGTTGTNSCIGVAPGVNWFCVNGGWVPPDSPLAPGGATQPPPPPPSTGTGCPGSAPGFGWVCLNGGWLPPDSPALWEAPSTSCPGSAPGVMWQCVNGGWIPPTSPPPPAPTTPPATACSGFAPAAGWVCVNGGWVPPDHPAALGAPSPAPTPTSPTQPTKCPGFSPGLGWLCINGGWVPPDHPLARGGGQ